MNSEITNNPGVPKRIRIPIADDSAAFRSAAGQFLDRLPQVEVVGTAEDGPLTLGRSAERRVIWGFALTAAIGVALVGASMWYALERQQLLQAQTHLEGRACDWGSASKLSGASALRTAGGLEIRDSADWKSASTVVAGILPAVSGDILPPAATPCLAKLLKRLAMNSETTKDEIL